MTIFPSPWGVPPAPANTLGINDADAVAVAVVGATIPFIVLYAQLRWMKMKVLPGRATD